MSIFDSSQSQLGSEVEQAMQAFRQEAERKFWLKLSSIPPHRIQPENSNRSQNEAIDLQFVSQFLFEPKEKAGLTQATFIQNTNSRPQILQPQIQQLPPRMEVQINRRRRNPNPPLREDYPKNITKVTIHRMVQQFRLIPDAQKAIRSMLDKDGMDYNQFEDLLKEIYKRNHISNTILLKMYLAPELNDPRFGLKKIFTEYYMFYLDNYFTLFIDQSQKVEKLKTYIQYSRKYLAYLAMMEDGTVRPSPNAQNIPTINRI